MQNSREVELSWVPFPVPSVITSYIHSTASQPGNRHSQETVTTGRTLTLAHSRPSSGFPGPCIYSFMCDYVCVGILCVFIRSNYIHIIPSHNQGTELYHHHGNPTVLPFYSCSRPQEYFLTLEIPVLSEMCL